MKPADLLVAALDEDGIDPTEAAVEYLDGQISELAEVLVEYFQSSDESKKPHCFDRASGCD